MNTMGKIFILVMVSLLFNLVFITYFISAFGYSSSYTVDNPLNVYPGETKEAQILLRTVPDEGNLTIKAEMLDNASIAELSDEKLEYEIGPGKDAVVNIKLKIPKNASLGEYSVKMKFSDITPSVGGGTVGFKGGFTVSLRPRVIEKPQEKPVEEEKITIGWIILGVVLVVAVVAVIIIIYFIYHFTRRPPILIGG